jgi:hypothetical protein
VIKEIKRILEKKKDIEEKVRERLRVELERVEKLEEEIK